MAAHPSEGNKLLRSAEMTLVQMFLSQEAAYTCVRELGEVGVIQFIDLNFGMNLFQRSFVVEIRRAEEMERQLRYLAKEVNKEKLTVPLEYDVPLAPATKDVNDIEVLLTQLETETKEIGFNYNALRKNHFELTELKHVLQKAEIFFQESHHLHSEHSALIQHDEEVGASRHLEYITGVIDRRKIPVFERVLWRSCRGNVFMKNIEIDEVLIMPGLVEDEEIPKDVFICFFQGEQLKGRVKKICEGFGANVYPCKDNRTEREAIKEEVMKRLFELNEVLDTTRVHRVRLLESIATDLRVWIVKVKKWKAIYYTLSKFSVDDSKTGFIAEGWVPVENMDLVHKALKRGSEVAGSAVTPLLNRIETSLIPPTYHKTNKLTNGYQVIIDAYGIATYQEMNPAIWTVISFPFLFGIMFGDMAHGFFLFLFGLYLAIKEDYYNKRLKQMDEIMAMLYHGRYIILMMGIFASYAGFLYNDIFSKATNVFGSSWHMPNTTWDYGSTDTITLDPKFDYDQVYPYGIDPMWSLAENKLTFYNSYKMKMAVVLGLAQMTYGICLSCVNYLYFGKTLDIWFTFIPQMVFLQCIIGYMVFLIFYKWIFITTFVTQPSILLTMINMFLDFGTVDDVDRFFGYQEYIQCVLVIIAVCMIPILLVGKPFAQKCMNKKPPPEYQPIGDSTIDQQGRAALEAQQAAAELDMWVHQGIHTIEFCLGCISNTASYLRLWALSLAHAELSEVLWTMILYYGFNTWKWSSGGFLLLIFCFFAWACLTVAILLVMEGMSAFLHALRLHWVEFQNKFYGGEGYPFLPYCFKRMLETEVEDEFC